MICRPFSVDLSARCFRNDDAVMFYGWRSEFTEMVTVRELRNNGGAGNGWLAVEAVGPFHRAASLSGGSGERGTAGVPS